MYTSNEETGNEKNPRGSIGRSVGRSMAAITYFMPACLDSECICNPSRGVTQAMAIEDEDEKEEEHRIGGTQ